MAGISEQLARVRQSMANVPEQSESLQLLDDLARQVKELQEKAASITIAEAGINVLTEADVKAAITSLKAKHADNMQKAKEDLSQHIRREYLAGKIEKIKFRDTTVTEELQYYRDIHGSSTSDQKMDLKALDVIPVFKGGSEYEFRSFEFPWLQAIRNRNIAEENLKTALYQRLQGSAQTWLLSLPRSETMTFGEIMEQMRKKYVEDRIAAQSNVLGMTQGSRETVDDFIARVNVTAKSMFPLAPKELKTYVVSDTLNVVIPNPFKPDEESHYSIQLNASKLALVKVVLQGLRPDIHIRLPAEQYVDFDVLVANAKKAEWMAKSGQQFATIHHLATAESKNESKTEDVNLLRQRKNFGKSRNFVSKNEQKSDQPYDRKRNPCFECGQLGHWKGDPVCPKFRAQEANAMTTQPPRIYRDRHYHWLKKQQGAQMTPRNYQGNQRHRLPERIYRKYAPLPLPPNPNNRRDPVTRNWIVRNRARYNMRKRQMKRLYHLDDDYEGNIDFSELDPLDNWMFRLESEIANEDSQAELEMYHLEVAAEGDMLEKEEEGKN